MIVQQARRAEELQRPQARVAHQMNEREIAEPETDFRDDDSHLRERRKREGRLDVRLHAPREVGKGRGDQAERDHQHREPRRAVEHGTHAQQQKDPEMYRERPVKHGARRRRAFHRARQPAGEWHERGLSRGSDDEEQPEQRKVRADQQRVVLRPCLRPDQMIEVTRAVDFVHQDRREHQRRIADAIDDPDPESVARRRRTFLEKCDQQHGGKPDHFPPGKQRLDRVRERRGDHAQEEDGEQHEEAVVAAFAVQIARGERGDRGAQHERQQDVGNREQVEDELEFQMVAAGDDPVPEFHRVLGRAGHRHRHSRRDRGQQAHRDRALDEMPDDCLPEFPPDQKGREENADERNRRADNGER